MPQRARETWDRLGRNNQIIVAAVSLGLLVALIGFIAWANTPEYVPLFSNLSAQDANAITSKLSKANVPYRLTQGGTAIEIPDQYHDKWQMKLLSENLPAQGGTANSSVNSLLSSSHMGDTQAIQDLRIRQAMDSQVAHTITSIDGVSSASVHFAPANNDPLEVDHHSSSAAVFLTLKPGMQLSDENVRAVVRLVQMSYTGLSDKNISVVDSEGNLLWDGTRTSSMADDEFHKQERTMEMRKRTDLQNLLDRDFGPGTSSVLVHLELNQDQTRRHDVTTTPGAPVSKFDDTEKLAGAGSATGKLPQVGMAGNMSGAPSGGVPSYAAATSGPNGNYSHEQTGETLQPNVATTDTEVAPGQIKRYDVSVLLDSTRFTAAQLPTVEAAITQIIQANIGYVPNDTTGSRLVTVSAVPFNHIAEKQAAAAASAAAAAANMQKMMTLFAPFLVMAIGLFLLARALRKTKPVDDEESQLALPGGGALNGTALLTADGVSPDEIPVEPGAIALSSGTEPHTFERIEEAFDSDLESILHLARSKPEMVAQLLKSWIIEDAA